MKLYNQIAVAIPFFNFNDFIQKIPKIKENKPDIVEIRFDYANLLKKISFDQPFRKTDLINLFKRDIFGQFDMKELRNLLKVPIIFTFRRKDQGGICDINEEFRVEIIKYLISLHPDYIDLEYDIELSLLHDLVGLAEQNLVHVIYSYHNWKETPSEEEVLKLIERLIKICPNVLDLKKVDMDSRLKHIIKVIFTAKENSDNETLLRVCRRYSEQNLKIICFAMGDLGIPSRVGSLSQGAFLSFASIEDSTAPGQINIQQFREIYHKNFS